MYKSYGKMKSEITYLAVRNQAEEWKAKGDGLLHTCWVDFKYPEEDAQKISAVKNAKRQEYEDKVPKNERYKLFFLKARRYYCAKEFGRVCQRP